MSCKARRCRTALGFREVWVIAYAPGEMADRSVEEELEQLLLAESVDLTALRAISRRPGGFLSHALRNRVWPKLLNLNRYELVDYRVFLDPHRDDSQVKCDVDRSLWSFRHAAAWTDRYREHRRTALSNIIMAILCRNNTLYYFQGFHDLVSVFLLVLEEDHLAFAVAEAVSLYFIRDCMQVDFVTISKLTPLLFNIVLAADKGLHTFLKRSGIEPFFAISWIITWFAHDIKDIGAIARLYDVMLCSPPSYSLYLAAAYLLHLRDAILQEDCDFATLHNFLVHAPENVGVPVEALLPVADRLLAMLPPDRLVRAVLDQRITALVKRQRVVMFSRGLQQRQQQLASVPADWVLLRRQQLRRSSSSLIFCATDTTDGPDAGHEEGLEVVNCCNGPAGGERGVYRWGWTNAFSASSVTTTGSPGMYADTAVAAAAVATEATSPKGGGESSPLSKGSSRKEAAIVVAAVIAAGASLAANLIFAAAAASNGEPSPPNSPK